MRIGYSEAYCLLLLNRLPQGSEPGELGRSGRQVNMAKWLVVGVVGANHGWHDPDKFAQLPAFTVRLPFPVSATPVDCHTLATLGNDDF